MLISPQLQDEYKKIFVGAVSIGQSAPHPNDNLNSFFDYLKRYFKGLDDIISKLTLDNNIKTACVKECNYCCHHAVEISAPEVFYIADQISKMNSKDRTAIVDRLDKTTNKIISISRNDHFKSNIPCAFLANKVCAIYKYRPAVCRRFHAQDIQNCINSFNKTGINDTNTEHEIIFTYAIAITGGFYEGLKKAQIDLGIYEINSAVRLALKSGHYLKRFKKGKKSFPELQEITTMPGNA